MSARPAVTLAKHDDRAAALRAAAAIRAGGLDAFVLPECARCGAFHVAAARLIDPCPPAAAPKAMRSGDHLHLADLELTCVENFLTDSGRLSIVVRLPPGPDGFRHELVLYANDVEKLRQWLR
jgi:hypothetical protein